MITPPELSPPELSDVIRPREWPEQIKFTREENQQPGRSVTTRPIRAAKAKGVTKLFDAINIQNEKERQMRIEDMKQRVSKRVNNESEEQIHWQLEDT